MADIAAETRFGYRRKTRHNRILLIASALVLTVLLGEGIFHFILAPNMRIENIIIDNDAPVRRDDILSAAGLQGQRYYFKIDVVAVKARLEALPAVKSAWVQKIFPSSLRITTRSRQPLAVAFAESPGGVFPVAFDEEGIVFLSGRDVPDTGFPVVSGLRFENFHAGMRLPEMLTPFLTDLVKLQKNSPALLSAFSEMKIVRKGNEQFEIVLYPVYSRVPVKMEGTLSAERCKTILIVLDALTQEGLLGKVEELDFRTEDLIYRFKEG
jgi:cell division protein FtsQ